MNLVGQAQTRASLVVADFAGCATFVANGEASGSLMQNKQRRWRNNYTPRTMSAIRPSIQTSKHPNIHPSSRPSIHSSSQRMGQSVFLFGLDDYSSLCLSAYLSARPPIEADGPMDVASMWRHCSALWRPLAAPTTCWPPRTIRAADLETLRSLRNV